MTSRETEIDRLTTLLGQCLGRIDEQAYRLQRSPEDGEDYEACDALERETALLQELISSVMVGSTTIEDTDVNRIVEQTLRGCVAEHGRPVVVRTRFAGGLPRAGCAAGQLSFAVQRALGLVLRGLGTGGEVRVSTRVEDGAVILEIEAHDSEPAHFGDRAATLTEFVRSLGGSCRSATDGLGTCLIAMQLPTVLVRD